MLKWLLFRHRRILGRASWKTRESCSRIPVSVRCLAECHRVFTHGWCVHLIWWVRGKDEQKYIIEGSKMANKIAYCLVSCKRFLWTCPSFSLNHEPVDVLSAAYTGIHCNSWCVMGFLWGILNLWILLSLFSCAI